MTVNTLSSRLPTLQTRASVQANGLLAVTPHDALDRLLPAIEKVTLLAGDVLYDVGDHLTHAYFPASAVVTLILPLSSASTTQVAVIGHEGVVGVCAFMGVTAHDRAVVLSPGEAFKVPVADMKTEFARNGAVMRLLLRFTQSLVTQMAQAAVCNRHHLVEQRLCTWLLTCMSRLPNGHSLPVTQEVVAGLLGVRREGISEAAGTLRQLGLIDFSRGRISLLDRPGLLTRACECYQVVKRETDRLLPDRPAT